MKVHMASTRSLVQVRSTFVISSNRTAAFPTVQVAPSNSGCLTYMSVGSSEAEVHTDTELGAASSLISLALLHAWLSVP